MSLTNQLLFEPVLGAGGFMLVSPWRPLIMLIPFVGWAWLVSKVFDKHAQRFHLGREMWNLGHLIAGVAAIAAVLFIPMSGWVGFLIGLLLMAVILLADIVLFAAITNRDDRVPEHERLKLDFSKVGEGREAKKAAKHQGSSTLGINGPKGSVSVPPKDSPEYGVRVAAEQLVLTGQVARASQVDIAPVNQQAYGVSLLVDGVRQAGEQIPIADAIKIIDFWKSAGGLDVEDRRRKQSGKVTTNTDAGASEMKVATSGSKGGMRLSLVFEPDKAVRRSLKELGLLSSQREVIDQLASEPGGVVLLAAPSDNGRTTTLYTMLKAHDAYTSNVQSLEYEMEDALEGVKQNIYDAGDEGPEYATQLRSMLRRDPNVVGVGELPDADTAKECADADTDRTRVYLSMKSDNAVQALQTYVKAVGDPKKAAKSLRAVVAQKLARKLCENCRVGYAPPPELLKKLGLPGDKVKQLYKKGGQVLIRNKPEVCPVCAGSGYSGQTGLFEVYKIGPAEQKLIAAQDRGGLHTQLKKTKQPSMSRAAMRKAAKGVTSIEEISRVTAASKSKPEKEKSSSSAG